MPSDPAITGRCYCGAVTVAAPVGPDTVTYCHCTDCKRWTGAAAPVFAGFERDALSLSPEPEPVSHAPGVTRWFCRSCGSALAARFDYLPGQLYVPLGVLDQTADLPPVLHCHAGAALPWLQIDDGLERAEASGRDTLNAAHGRAP